MPNNRIMGHGRTVPPQPTHPQYARKPRGPDPNPFRLITDPPRKKPSPKDGGVAPEAIINTYDGRVVESMMQPPPLLLAYREAYGGRPIRPLSSQPSVAGSILGLVSNATAVFSIPSISASSTQQGALSTATPFALTTTSLEPFVQSTSTFMGSTLMTELETSPPEGVQTSTPTPSPSLPPPTSLSDDACGQEEVTVIAARPFPARTSPKKFVMRRLEQFLKGPMRDALSGNTPSALQRFLNSLHANSKGCLSGTGSSASARKFWGGPIQTSAHSHRVLMVLRAHHGPSTPQMCNQIAAEQNLQIIESMNVTLPSDISEQSLTLICAQRPAGSQAKRHSKEQPPVEVAKATMKHVLNSLVKKMPEGPVRDQLKKIKDGPCENLDFWCLEKQGVCTGVEEFPSVYSFMANPISPDTIAHWRTAQEALEVVAKELQRLESRRCKKVAAVISQSHTCKSEGGQEYEVSTFEHRNYPIRRIFPKFRHYLTAVTESAKECAASVEEGIRSRGLFHVIRLQKLDWCFRGWKEQGQDQDTSPQSGEQAFKTLKDQNPGQLLFERLTDGSWVPHIVEIAPPFSTQELPSTSTVDPSIATFEQIAAVGRNIQALEDYIDTEEGLAYLASSDLIFDFFREGVGTTHRWLSGVYAYEDEPDNDAPSLNGRLDALFARVLTRRYRINPMGNPKSFEQESGNTTHLEPTQIDA